MPGYKELIHHYNLTEEEDGRIHGTRRFIQSEGGPLDLPTRGSSLMPGPNGSAITGCVCRRIQATRDPNDRQFQHIAYYDTRSTLGSTGAINVNPDPASRDYSSETEVISIPVDGVDWVWEGSDQIIDEATNLYKRVQYIRYTRTRHAMTTAQKDALLTTIRTVGGTINDAAFDGFAIGQVHFDGIAHGGDYIDESGVRRWSFSLAFTARLLTGEFAGAAITQDDWLYQFSEQTARWDKPKNQSGDYLFIKTDFSSLFPS